MLDLDTLTIAALVPAMTTTVILAAMRRSFPPEIRGLGYFTVAAALFTVTLIAYAFQQLGRMEHLIVSQMSVLCLALITLYLGIREFVNKPEPHRTLWIIFFVIFVFALNWFTFIDHRLIARNLLTSAAYSILFLASGYFMHSWTPRTLATLLTSATLLVAALISMLRFATLTDATNVDQFMLGPVSLHPIFLGSLPVLLQIVSVGMIIAINERLQQRLSFLATHDGLTGAFSRGAFFHLLEREIRRDHRHQRASVVAMIDLDHFKQINDRFGHQMGDRVLVDFVRRTSSMLRSQDIIGRYGGEEFALVFPETPLAEALLVAERIRSAISKTETSDLPTYSVSIGVALTKGENADAAMNSADQALYRAKNNGRNRVEYSAGVDAVSG